MVTEGLLVYPPPPVHWLVKDSFWPEGGIGGQAKKNRHCTDWPRVPRGTVLPTPLGHCGVTFRAYKIATWDLLNQRPAKVMIDLRSPTGGGGRRYLLHIVQSKTRPVHYKFYIWVLNSFRGLALLFGRFTSLGCEIWLFVPVFGLYYIGLYFSSVFYYSFAKCIEKGGYIPPP